MKAILYRDGFTRMIEIRHAHSRIDVPLASGMTFEVVAMDAILPMDVKGISGPRWIFALRNWVVEGEIALYKFEREVA